MATSPVVTGYVRAIKAGLKTLEEVPEKYRAEVAALL